MTEQEIVDELNFCIETGERPYNEVLEKCKKTLKKQIAKKPKDEGMIAGFFQHAYTCPTCGNCCLTMKMNERQNTKFCWDCGQKLDWE